MKRRACQRGYEQKKRAALQARILLLKSVPCADCGKSFHPVCMDFDHRDGESKLDCVATMVHNLRRWELILAEIAKCDVVCACCHRLRTLQRGQHYSQARSSTPSELPLFAAIDGKTRADDTAGGP